MLDTRELYADVYEVWTENIPLMTQAEERQALLRHDNFYRTLIHHIENRIPTWFPDHYPELNLSGPDWFDVLWRKRPYSRHIVSGLSQLTNLSSDDSIRTTYSDWLNVREHILSSNVRLVLKAAHRNVDEHVDFMDLVQEGQFGLIRALERFDCNQQWRFSTYAMHWITQFIRLAIKKQSKVVSIPTNVQDRLSRYRQAVIQSQQRAGRSTSFKEIASVANADLNDVEQTLALGLPVNSLNDSQGRYEDSEEPINFIASELAIPEQLYEEKEQKSLVSGLIQGLSQREQLVLKMRYGIGMAQTYGYREIAEQLSLSRERIRQIEAELLTRLTDDLSNHTLRY